jgi:hypothetical protein
MAHLLALIESSVGAHGAPAHVEPAVGSKTWKAQVQAKRKIAHAEATCAVKKMRANLRGRSRQLHLEKKLAQRGKLRGKLSGPVLKERIKLMVASRMLKRQIAKAAAAEQDKVAAQRAWNSTQLRTQGFGSIS